ncbi:sensor histidine kinase [Mangrovibacterium lignilyticum]|uniref:sensor histidine kinase n=1 Tax=Mangrovibacterium lignilyticum TaxID=2668052 RepID=UPI0013D394B0|nr:HAMP domain-containing sensor histidine kinase [Mangrovibacterium lignilyticum]
MKNGQNIGRDFLGLALDQQISIENIQLVKELLSETSSVICILNHQNKIVFANEKLLLKYGIDIERDIFGLRFGEVMNCVNLLSPESVCGTTDKCKYCGANYAFNDFWTHKTTVVNECRLIRAMKGHTEQYDLEITATPFHFENDYMIVSVVDITDQKRREILERIFFHDIINMAGSLKGILSLLPETQDTDPNEFLEIASSLSSQIIEEIKAQQQMLEAEKGELEISTEKVEMLSFLKEVSDKVKYCQEAFERNIIIQDHTDNAQFTTDRVLLTRVVFNMAKNALEAIMRGKEIRIQASISAGKVRIEVHNQTYMEDDVRNQLFQRSYSTKGKNRGLGTYSMKLLGERYLKGKVNFSSDTETGTTFYIEIPESI